ncbi:hypothetical protein DY000_02053246 [Brassica cretica]|uniref:Uncharacterized protein n=1 Tax=Brassica cretica TaxID=69181 RepID=A0ABQ7ABP1_BRACR|nr:hypothetical protein DY000_02053246 [Brassica cretica]
MAIGPHTSQARTLRSDRARTWLGRYIAPELEPKLGRYIATDLEPKLGRYVATELEPKLGLYVATEHTHGSVPM